MDYKTRRSLLITVTAFVWAAALAASFGRFKLAARPPVTIALATKPPAVKITIDGERQFEGIYTDTPIKLAIPPGRHKLKISRDGYVAHLVTVEADSGETFHMEDVVLQKNANFIFASVDVDGSPGDPAAHVDIDDGLIKGDTPLSTHELIAEGIHNLTVYPNWPDQEVKFRCKFTPEAPDQEGNPYHIKLKVRAGRVRAVGCEKVKGGKK